MLRESFNRGWVLNPTDKSVSFMSRETAVDDLPVTLPYDAMLRKQRNPGAEGGSHTGYFPNASCTLEKEFDVPEDWRGKCVTLEFEGVYTNSMVYINGDWAGGCPHGYTRFLVPADDFLKYGKTNTVKVQAKTARDSRWYSGMGIYRGVNLLLAAPVHIAPNGYRVSSGEVDAEGAVVTVSAQVCNRDRAVAGLRLATTLRDAAGSTVAQGEEPLTVFGGGEATLKQRLYLPKPRLWDLEDPHLYTATTQVFNGDTLLDESTTTFGVRTLALDVRHGLRINGKTVKLRGACVHHDNGLLGAAAIPRAEERRVQLLKAAGFNAIRSAHNPISDAFLDACDRHGLVVMDELTDMWTRRKTEHDYATAFPTHWPALVQDIVDKDYNHPSVVMYSIGNEIMENGTPHGAGIARKLADRLREEDPTRYTINSANLMMAVMEQIPKPGQSTDVNEVMTDVGTSMAQLTGSELVSVATQEMFAAVDIAGYNYATSRYVADRTRFPNRVLCGSETFPKEIAGNWKVITENEHVIGDFTWTGWDYLGEAGIGRMSYEEDGAAAAFNAPYPWYIAWCGDIDITGHRRPVSYYREIVFGLRTRPYIAVRYPHTYGKTLRPGMWDFVDGIASWTWTGSEGKPVEVEVYAPGDRVELLLDGQKVGEAALTEFKAVIGTTYRPGELVAVAYEGGRELGRTALATAGQGLKLRCEADRAAIRADDSDLCYVSIALTDENGVVNNMADRPVRVRVEGAGVLAGLGSANPQGEESFLSDSFTSFDGRLLAVVRPTGAGKIRLTTSAEGCGDVSVEITAG